MWAIYPAKKARFSKFSNKYYHIPGGANSSFYKSHFINIKLRLITNQLRKEELKIYNWQRYLY